MCVSYARRKWASRGKVTIQDPTFSFAESSSFVGNCILEKESPSDVQIVAWQFAKLGSKTEFGLPAARLQLSVGQVPEKTLGHTKLRRCSRCTHGGP